MRTVVVSLPTLPEARVPANVVLNAFSTFDEGRAAAISAAAELSAGTTSPSNVSTFTRVGDVDDDLAGELVAALRQNLADRRVVDGEDDHVAGHRLVHVGGVERLDRVPALGDEAGEGRAHVPGTDDADVCHAELLTLGIE